MGYLLMNASGLVILRLAVDEHLYTNLEYDFLE